MSEQGSERTSAELLGFLEEATSPFHVVEAAKGMLSAKGFFELDMKKEWMLKSGGKYFTVPYGTTLFAFAVGETFDEGKPIRIASAHTDYPCLRVKPKAEMEQDGYLKLDVEVYGGPILNTWLDRPLSIAGKVALKGEDSFNPEAKLVDFHRALLTIPNLPIHFNRDVNKGVELNKQKEMLPIIGLISDELSKDNFVLELLAEELCVDEKDILDFDLYIYNEELGCRLGAREEFLSAPRLDNLSSCYAGIVGLSDEENNADTLSILALYDNEEIGSRSKQGADSMITNILIEKIYDGLELNRRAINVSILRGFMLSMDVAHAFHPNYPEKFDPNMHCITNKGVVIKLNYNQKYATDTEAVGTIVQLCEENDIPYQKYVNRSDIAGGGTLGVISAAYLPMKGVDVGVGIMAMHSAREIMGFEDEEHLVNLVKAFYR